VGTAVIGQGKDYNAPRVRELANELRRRFGERGAGAFTGDEVLHAHLTLAETV
jgi:hypothetical protein